MCPKLVDIISTKGSSSYETKWGDGIPKKHCQVKNSLRVKVINRKGS